MDSDSEIRTVDVHIRRLRKALNEYGPDYIRTIRATGNSIDDHESLITDNIDSEFWKKRPKGVFFSLIDLLSIN